jgi:hypothetical protein
LLCFSRNHRAFFSFDLKQNIPLGFNETLKLDDQNFSLQDHWLRNYRNSKFVWQNPKERLPLTLTELHLYCTLTGLSAGMGSGLGSGLNSS